jgi:hypothetical protein
MNWWDWACWEVWRDRTQPTAKRGLQLAPLGAHVDAGLMRPIAAALWTCTFPTGTPSCSPSSIPSTSSRPLPDAGFQSMTAYAQFMHRPVLLANQNRADASQHEGPRLLSARWSRSARSNNLRAVAYLQPDL